jgi:hypothetical protein
MMDKSWNPWKLTALGLVLVMATALITGLVVANWSGTNQDAAEQKAATATASKPAAPTRVATAPHPAPAPRVAQAPAVPTQDVVDACNRYAAGQAGDQNKTTEVVKDAAIGAVVGAAVGAAGGAVAGGGKGAGKGAAIGGIVGAGGGTLYGLNENKKHDEKYKEAYAGCMRSKGYTG